MTKEDLAGMLYESLQAKIMPLADDVIMYPAHGAGSSCGKSLGKETAEENIEFLEKIAPEKNAIIDKFKAIGITSKSAFETQSLLQLKNEYCNKSNCLQCAVGLELLKN